MPTRVPARPASAALVWTAILILYFVWGSTYLGIRVAVETIPPFLMGAVRFAIAGGVLLAAVAMFRRRTATRPTRREWRDSFIIGACLMGGGMGAVAWGEQTVPSGVAGVLIAMLPLWVAVLGRVFLNERLPRLGVVGIAAGVAGVVLLVGQGVGIDGSLDPAGVAALIFSPISWAAGSLFSAHRARLPKDPFLTTGMEMVSGSLVLAVAAVVTGEAARFRPEAVSTESLLSVAYLTVVGSLIAFTAFAWVLRQAPLPLIATYAFVNPIVAVFLGWLVLDESVAPIQLVAGAVIIIGVALLIVSRSRMSAPRPARARSRVEREAEEVGAA